jgi:DUF3102 family protein
VRSRKQTIVVFGGADFLLLDMVKQAYSMIHRGRQAPPSRKDNPMDIAVHKQRRVSRPLKVLIPLIQSELQMANDAGRDHYRRAGEMLIEAKELISYGQWGRWLSKNFDLSARTAQVYMQWARDQMRGADAHLTVRQMTGHTERAREGRQSKQHQDFKRILRDVARDEFVQERQARDDEIRLHRELAEELIDLGYRALATRLHPDRGGTKDAMTRLNRVRDELKSIAETRRFV